MTVLDDLATRKADSIALGDLKTHLSDANRVLNAPAFSGRREVSPTTVRGLMSGIAWMQTLLERSEASLAEVESVHANLLLDFEGLRDSLDGVASALERGDSVVGQVERMRHLVRTARS